jgi:hypothetical protein
MVSAWCFQQCASDSFMYLFNWFWVGCLWFWSPHDVGSSELCRVSFTRCCAVLRGVNSISFLERKSVSDVYQTMSCTIQSFQNKNKWMDRTFTLVLGWAMSQKGRHIPLNPTHTWVTFFSLILSFLCSWVSYKSIRLCEVVFWVVKAWSFVIDGLWKSHIGRRLGVRPLFKQIAYYYISP